MIYTLKCVRHACLVCMQAWMCVYMYICMYVCMYIYILYMYI